MRSKLRFDYQSVLRLAAAYCYVNLAI
jgi:hypothetical protein